MLSKDSTHLLNRKRINFVASAEMGAPVALNDGQQTGHLGKHRLVGHSIGISFSKALTCPLGKRWTVVSTLNFEGINAAPQQIWGARLETR